MSFETWNRKDVTVLLAGAIIDLETVGLYNGIYPDAENKIEQALKILRNHNYKRKKMLDLKTKSYGSSERR